jgi:hypothetical protein
MMRSMMAQSALCLLVLLASSSIAAHEDAEDRAHRAWSMPRSVLLRQLQAQIGSLKGKY